MGGRILFAVVGEARVEREDLYATYDKLRKASVV
jgi:hypothetical protein